MDVVQLVKEGKGKYDWFGIASGYRGHKLYLNVLRDAMKFDDMPAMTWQRKPIAGDNRRFNGVRVPATAHELQQIADLVGGMLLTPKVIDLIWLQARLKFDCIANLNGKILAVCNIHDVHEAIEATIKKLGGDDGTRLISCVGKYWCLIQDLAFKGMLQGDWTACNYGWCAKKASGPGLTPGVQCWQRPGFCHNKLHWDPSQTIRLMHRYGYLVRADGTEGDVDLHDVAQDPELCGLLTHDGKPLTYLRQKGVDVCEPIAVNGVITLPEVIIQGRAPKNTA